MRHAVSNADPFVHELRAAAEAHVPVVCIVTHEERRAVALVGQAFRGSRVYEWTVTRASDSHGCTSSITRASCALCATWQRRSVTCRWCS